MKIKTYGMEYLVYFRRAKDTQTIEIIEASGDDEVTGLIYSTFRGRLKNNSVDAPFVKVLVKRLDQIKKTSTVIMSMKVYNLSPRNARIEIENAIRQSQ